MAGLEALHETRDDEEPVMPRRPMEDTEMDITPMIDITFLLLIFFLVASKMTPQDAVDLPVARPGFAVVNKSSVVLKLTHGTGEHVKVIADDGSEFSGSNIDEQEQSIVDYVESQMGDAGEKTEILIMAAADLKHGEVDRVEKAIGRANVDVEYLHVAVEEID